MAEPINLHKPGELPVLTHSPSVAQAMQAAGWGVVSAAQAHTLRAAEEEQRLANEADRQEAERLANEAGKNATVALLPDAEIIYDTVTQPSIPEELGVLEPAEAETDGSTTASADDGGGNRRRTGKSTKSAN